MNGQIFYFIFLTASVLLLAGSILYICALKDHTMYDFRNVGVASLCPGMTLLLSVLLFRYPERMNFSALAFALDFPAVFANLCVALFIVMGIAMAVSNVSLMRHEGMSLKNTFGTLLQLAWILATVFAYAVVCFLKARTQNASEAARLFSGWMSCLLYCLIDYGECMTLGIMIMGWVAAHGRSAYDKDYIIIPGCSISKTGGLLPLLKGRVNRAIRYAWEQEIATGKPVSYVPSGGKGTDEIMSEGSAMEFYLLSHSAEDYEILPEKKSTNTAENFLFSAEIIRKQNPQAKVAFATTNYHVLRCGMLAKRAGLIAEGIASSTKWYFWPNGFAREVAAIFVMTKKYHLAAAAVLLILSFFLTLAGV